MSATPGEPPPGRITADELEAELEAHPLFTKAQPGEDAVSITLLGPEAAERARRAMERGRRGGETDPGSPAA